jgi:hypothetical protein
MSSLPLGRYILVQENAPDARILELLDRLREAHATVDEVTMPDGTSRLLITIPLVEVLEEVREDNAA